MASPPSCRTAPVTGFPLIRENLTIFSSQGIREKQGFSGTIREFFPACQNCFCLSFFFSLGRVRLSGFLSMSGAGLSCI